MLQSFTQMRSFAPFGVLAFALLCVHLRVSASDRGLERLRLGTSEFQPQLWPKLEHVLVAVSVFKWA